MTPVASALQAANDIVLFKIILQLRDRELELVLHSAIHVDDVTVSI